MGFIQAQKQRTPPKIAIFGPSGSGKTWGALSLARGMVGKNGRIALIDSENNSSCLYADLTTFDVWNLTPKPLANGVPAYSVQEVTKAIQEAERAGYNAVIIDSASIIWASLLDLKQCIDETAKGSQFANWKEPKKQLAEIKKIILNSSLAVLCCFREKKEYVLAPDNNGKQVPQLMGVGLDASKGAEYDFSLVFSLDQDHKARIYKSRFQKLDGGFCAPLTVELGQRINEFFNRK